MTEPIGRIADILRDAAETHHVVYRIVDGVDSDWASWYADWLVNLSPLAEALGSRPVRSELVWLLVDLDKWYVAHQPDRPWETVYAERLLAHFAPPSATVAGPSAEPPAPEAPHQPAWTGMRAARPAADLDRSVRFYRDLLGLPVIGRFDQHDGYDGVFFALPGGGELELTAGPAQPLPSTDEDLLVLYVSTPGDVAAIGNRLAAAGVPTIPSANPYWNRCGQTFLDPDGYRIVIATA
jgi:catechol 2,3-dioxygenase-like lactoylglutathione lyase family enzyme